MKVNIKLKEIMKLIGETFNLSVSFYRNDSNKCIYEIKKNQESQCCFEFEPGMKYLIDIINKSSIEIPKIILTPYYENYIGVIIKDFCGENGVLIIGPSLYTNINENSFKNICGSLSKEKLKELVGQYQKLPIIPFDKLNNIARIIYFMIYETYITVEEIIEENFYDLDKIAAASRQFSRDFSVARQNSEFHHSYEREKVLFDCIKRGDTKALLYNLNRPLDGKVGILAEKNPLRSEKNIAISMAAIATRTIIEEGVPEELAYGVNDSFVRLIEEANSIEQVKSLMITMLCNFSNLVKENRAVSYSKLVKSCWDYIFINLYERISVEEISKELKCNANYLSRVFKKEVGKTISEVITYERIEESKRLLKYTKFSIIDIATLMQFNDQSHFTRVFKKETGFTPKKYRQKY